MDGLLVFGQSGQVARELAIQAPAARFLGRDAADLTDPDACARAIQNATVVINAAAYTAVDRAETEPELCRLINAEAPTAMARACRAQGIPFLHISTDYVFDGSGEAPRNESAPCAPLNVYGASKLAGERAIVEQGGQTAILRTSWVFSAHGGNFVKTMHRLGASHDRLNIVADQIGGPTPAADIAAALLVMAKQMKDDRTKRGIYHFSGAPSVSWAEFATQIFQAGGQCCQVDPIPTSDYPTPARRPLNSRLDCSRILKDFGIPQPSWKSGLIPVLNQQEKL